MQILLKILFIWGWVCFVSMVIVEGGTDDINKSDGTEGSDIEMFKKLFAQKRIIQLGAIKQLKGLAVEKRTKMLTAMTTKMFQVLTNSRITLESSGIAQAVEELPKDAKIKDALALVIENTCLASEILLNFPNYLHLALNSDKDANSVFRWSLTFSHGIVSESLVDEHTKKLLKLALMELNVLPRDDNYHNPYVQEGKPTKKLDFVDKLPQPKKKEKKKIPKGPRLSRSDL